MVKVKIERYSDQIEGIGYYNGKVIFVPKTIVGEIVDVDIVEEKTKYYRGIIKEAKNMVDCPYFFDCGGCSLRRLEYLDGLNLKRESLLKLFKKNELKIPKFTLIKNQNPFFYRNKISLKIVDGKIGFYKEKTNSLVEISSCLITKEEINRFLEEIPKFKIKNGTITIRCNYNDELLIIIDTEDIIKYDFSLLKEEYKIAGVVLNKKAVLNNDYFFDKIGNYLFKVSYDSFFQVNNYGASQIFEIISNNITSDDIVLDLYSGVGTLSIVAAKKAKEVIGVEVVENAVLNALVNKDVNKTDNVMFMLGNVPKIIDKINKSFNTIIFDPPRTGLDKYTTDYTLNKLPDKVIYVSCNPITLVRDLKNLSDKYTIKELYLVDMFSYTHHCESIAVLERR